MGAPTSSIFSEIFLQWLENTTIYDILFSHNIVAYFRYVDDILVIYNDTDTNLKNVLNLFNNLSPKLKFTVETEIDRKLNYLDLSITRNQDNLKFNIYRKPTTTDNVIPNDSCHPNVQKLASFRHFISRMNSYSLDKTDRTKELDTIKHIAYKNKYDTTVIDTLNDHFKNRKVKTKDTHNTKWATISYIGKETNSIARLFKNTDVKIAYTTKNFIQRLLTPRVIQRKDPYNNN
jgi:hypothetical protein